MLNQKHIQLMLFYDPDAILPLLDDVVASQCVLLAMTHAVRIVILLSSVKSIYYTLMSCHCLCWKK